MKTGYGPISSPPNTGRSWHLSSDLRWSGCRGVIGPIPRPLLMRFRVSESNIQLSKAILQGRPQACQLKNRDGSKRISNALLIQIRRCGSQTGEDEVGRLSISKPVISIFDVVLSIFNFPVSVLRQTGNREHIAIISLIPNDFPASFVKISILEAQSAP